MDVLEAIRERRSIRQFKKKPLAPLALDALIDGLRWAPSAGNLQSRVFYFVLNGGLKAALARAAFGQDFIAEAPVVVVACADHRVARRYGERGVELYSLMDVATSVQNLLLVAHAQGFGSCWVGAFDEEAVRSLLNLPSYLRPVTIVPVGFPAEHPKPPIRVSREEAVIYLW